MYPNIPRAWPGGVRRREQSAGDQAGREESANNRAGAGSVATPSLPLTPYASPPTYTVRSLHPKPPTHPEVFWLAPGASENHKESRNGEWSGSKGCGRARDPLWPGCLHSAPMLPDTVPARLSVQANLPGRHTGCLADAAGSRLGQPASNLKRTAAARGGPQRLARRVARALSHRRRALQWSGDLPASASTMTTLSPHLEIQVDQWLRRYSSESGRLSFQV